MKAKAFGLNELHPIDGIALCACVDLFLVQLTGVLHECPRCDISPAVQA